MFNIWEQWLSGGKPEKIPNLFEEEANNGNPVMFTCPCCSPEYCRWNSRQNLFLEELVGDHIHLRLNQVQIIFTARILKAGRNGQHRRRI